jgi:hypothetical protein
VAEQISVTVDDKGKISADPNPLSVGQSNGNVTIKWVMDTPGWEITDVSGLPNSEFPTSGKDGGTGWKVTDKNDNTNDYRYQVTATHTESGQVLRHDPTIRNGGRNG